MTLLDYNELIEHDKIDGFKTLYESSIAMVSRECQKYFCSDDNVSVIIKEIYKYIYYHIQDTDPNEDALEYVKRVTTEKCLEYVKSSKAGDESVNDAGEDQSINKKFDSLSENFRTDMDLSDEVPDLYEEKLYYNLTASLQDIERTCLLMWSENKSISEISTVLGITEAQAKLNIVNGMSKVETTAEDMTKKGELAAGGISAAALLAAAIKGMSIRNDLPDSMPDQGEILAHIMEEIPDFKTDPVDPSGHSPAEKRPDPKQGSDSAEKSGADHRNHPSGSQDPRPTDNPSRQAGKNKPGGKKGLPGKEVPGHPALKTTLLPGLKGGIAGKIATGIVAAALLAGTAKYAMDQRQAREPERADTAYEVTTEMPAETTAETAQVADEDLLEDYYNTSIKDNESFPEAEGNGNPGEQQDGEDYLGSDEFRFLFKEDEDFPELFEYDKMEGELGIIGHQILDIDNDGSKEMLVLTLNHDDDELTESLMIYEVVDGEVMEVSADDISYDFGHHDDTVYFSFEPEENGCLFYVTDYYDLGYVEGGFCAPYVAIYRYSNSTVELVDSAVLPEGEEKANDNYLRNVEEEFPQLTDRIYELASEDWYDNGSYMGEGTLHDRSLNPFRKPLKDLKETIQSLSKVELMYNIPNFVGVGSPCEGRWESYRLQPYASTDSSTLKDDITESADATDKTQFKFEGTYFKEEGSVDVRVKQNGDKVTIFLSRPVTSSGRTEDYLKENIPVENNKATFKWRPSFGGLGGYENEEIETTIEFYEDHLFLDLDAEHEESIGEIPKISDEVDDSDFEYYREQ